MEVVPLCLVVLLAGLRGTLQTPLNTTCGDTDPPTELFFLPSNGSFDNLCECYNSSTRCSWISLADRGEILHNGTGESRFVWDGDTLGYGQYRCIDNLSNVVKNLLILPDGENNDMNAECVLKCKAWFYAFKQY